MAGQEVSLSLRHTVRHHVSNAFMAGHKSKKLKNSEEIRLTPKDRVELFMQNGFARYCAFNHLENGDVIQVAVPALWRTAVTIIGGDDDMPVLVEGIMVIHPEKRYQSPWFVGKSSRWVVQAEARRARRLVFARTYLVRYSEQGGYEPELLLDNDEWLEAEKVRKAAEKLAALYDDEVDLCMYLGHIQTRVSKNIKAAWCVGMRRQAVRAIICDLDNGALHFVNVKDIAAVASDALDLKTDFLRLQRGREVPAFLVRRD